MLKVILIIKDILFALVSLSEIWKGFKNARKLGSEPKVCVGENKGTSREPKRSDGNSDNS